jgi:hypothetical protein
LTNNVEADWEKGDDYKMHFPQLPDPYGWDVYATALVEGFPDVVLADDFRCTETGYIKDIHFWGSWRKDIVGTIDYFVIGISEDIPAKESPTGYSMPGETLKEWTIREWKESKPIDPPGMQGWYEPHSGVWNENDHENYYQYNIFLNEDQWFKQTEGEIYWLFISAIVKQTPGIVQPLWGWKSSNDHWNDDACEAYWYELRWVDLWEPQPGPITNDFWVELDDQSMVVERNSGGIDYYDDGESINGWYYYPNTNWWNIWFYDHPFDPDRYKEVVVNLFAMPTGRDAWILVAINWATDQWTGENPPIPPLTEGEEERYIGREIIFESYDFVEPIYLRDYLFEIPWYNPEWISIDVIGKNVMITQGESYITHECLPKKEQSLDLAFVITGGKECECELEIEIESGFHINSLPVNIENTGSMDCNNIIWSITSTPILGKISCNSNGNIATLAIGDMDTVSCNPVGTIGLLKITADATVCSKNYTDENYAVVIGPFIFVF